MVETSFWYVSLASPNTVAAAKEAIGSLLERAQADAPFMDALGEWHATPSVVDGSRTPDGRLSPQAEALVGGFRRLQLSEDQLLELSVPETENTTWDLAGERPDPCDGLFSAVRGLPVLSLLLMGLGPLRSGWLPGSYGLFALSSDEVASAVDGIRHAHAFSPADRAAALSRMHDWLTVGSDPGAPVDHLLEGLPEVVASAISRSVGMISIPARAGSS
jgi:hypothetical protein